MKITTVAMGEKNFINDYRDVLKDLASVDSETGEALQFEAGFDKTCDRSLLKCTRLRQTQLFSHLLYTIVDLKQYSTSVFCINHNIATFK